MATPRQSCRLTQKRERQRRDNEPGWETTTCPPCPKKKKKTNAEMCRDYKDRLKENDEKFQLYKQKQKEYSKQYRATSDEERKQKLKEQSRLRMQKMREKRRNEANPSNATRKTVEEQRAVWREQYQRRKMKQTPQKRVAINKKRREKYQNKKKKVDPCVPSAASENIQLQVQAPATPQLQVPTPEKPTPQSEAARRKALSRAKKGIPKSPLSYARCVRDLEKKVTPRKKAAFEKIDSQKTATTSSQDNPVNIGNNVLQEIANLASKRSLKANMARRILKYSCSSSIKRKLTFDKAKHSSPILLDSLHRVKKEKPRKKEKEVRDFLESECITLPQKKLVSRKTGLGAKVLTKPISDLYKDFKESTNHEISFSQFARLRPQHIKLANKNLLRQCLCEYCENVNLKLMEVNKCACREDVNCKIRHPYHAVDIITCGRRNKQWRKECVSGQCGDCGPDKLDNFLRPLLQPGRDMTWKKWQASPTMARGKQVMRKMLVQKTGYTAEFFKELKDEIVFLAGHLYRADWQYRQFERTQQQVPRHPGTVCMVLDFAENFTCSHQDEVQAAHWHHEQVTVHPIVSYYACPRCQTSNVTEALVFISDDKKHDYHAVHAFTKAAINHLRCVRQLDINHITEWTDGCASQYKSKGPFSDVSNAIQDYGCSLERNFFGSRHGKGPSDGEKAVVKGAASQAVKSGQTVIQNAEELFQFCKDSSLNKQPKTDLPCKDSHHLRTFFLLKETDIRRSRHRLVKTLKGTRNLHAVRCVEKKCAFDTHIVLCVSTMLQRYRAVSGSGTMATTGTGS